MLKDIAKQLVSELIDKDLSQLDELNKILNEVGIPDISFSIKQIGIAAGKLVSKKLVETGTEIATQLSKRIEEKLTTKLIDEALNEINFDKLVKQNIQNIVKGQIPFIIKESLLSKTTGYSGSVYGNMKNTNELKNKILNKTNKSMLSKVDEIFVKE